ncbi:uncharacterized protein BYT42DRAFT_241590 [Radiomyces spectabilis]|uniref:uncharacterized protein n=1 Tax=Radiomyces spectabilis TaxID=64574 RepID=UPI00221E55CD|nr:uncharacterized protein BYT42DRAFT_241590 [Radiomyces spectabilis]KAI8388631.1 hypothetical protein BYT42DRAFT_241590 [Radiomyces spectabilis]
MLSASTVHAAPLDAFMNPASTSPPLSSFSLDSNKKSTALSELIQSEKDYIEKLETIATQISPLWKEEATATAPDFTELLTYANDIFVANTQFCAKLDHIAANPHTMRDLGDVLMQWSKTIELPYGNFSRSYITHLNQRQDIASLASIQQLLHNLSTVKSCDITLEYLFNAPLKRMQYYKVLYNNLLDSTEVGGSDHALVSAASNRIDAIMSLIQETSPLSSLSSSFVNSSTSIESSQSTTLTLPQIKTDFHLSNQDTPAMRRGINLKTFVSQMNCSQVVDFATGAPMSYSPQLINTDARLIVHNHFMLLPENEIGRPVRVRATLTSEQLLICKETTNETYLLIYPAFALRDVAVQSILLNREIVGEYFVQLTIHGKSQLTLRADAREVRNMWLGLESTAANAAMLSPKPLQVVVQMHAPDSGNAPALQNGVQRPPLEIAKTKKKRSMIRREDVFSFYGENSGEISPLESSSDESDDDMFESRASFLPVVPPKDLSGMSGPNAASKSLPKAPSAAEPTGEKLLPELPPIVPVKDFMRSSFSVSDFPGVPNTNSNSSTSASASTSTLASGSASASTSTTSTSQMNAKQDSNKRSSLEILIASIAVGESDPAALKTETASLSSSTSSSTDRSKDKRVADLSLRDPMTPPASRSPTPNSAVRERQAHDMGSRPVTPRLSPESAAFPMTNKPLPRTSSIRSATMPPPGQQYPPPPPQHQQMRPPAHNGRSPSPMVRGPSGPYPQRPSMQISSAPGYAPTRSMSLNPAGSQLRPTSMMIPQQRPGSPRPPPYNQPVAARSASSLRASTSSKSHTLSRDDSLQRSAPPTPLMRPSLSSGTTSSSSLSPYHSPAAALSTPAVPTYLGQQSVPRPALVSGTPRLTAPGQEDAGSPPRSPNMMNGNPNGIRQVLYSHGCEVFHWKDESWYAVDGECLLEVRQTFTNRSCVAIRLQSTAQLYLNAWILPSTLIRRPSETDVTLSVFLGPRKEMYLVHFTEASEAERLTLLLNRMYQESLRVTRHESISPPSSVRKASLLDENISTEELAPIPQTLKLVMQCKCKLFVQNEHSNWSSFGSVTMKISQQLPSKKMHIHIDVEKSGKATKKLVSASVQSRNVERINPKRISFLLVNEQERTSMVYMVQIREEQTGNKIYEYLKLKNAENGW